MRPEEFSSEDQVRYVLLKEAESEITATRKISDKLKQEMFADNGLRKLWDSAQKEYEDFYLRRTGSSAAQMTKAMEAKPDVRTVSFSGPRGKRFTFSVGNICCHTKVRPSRQCPPR